MTEQIDSAKKLRRCGEVLDYWTRTKESHHGARLNQVLSRASEVRESALWNGQVLVSEILPAWMKVEAEQRERNAEAGHLFNPLAGLPIGETTHSRLLGELLDPRGSHGQGRILLNAFLEQRRVPRPADGNWTVTIESGGVDICLRRRDPASVIIIENKSNKAQDQAHQLYRYWLENIHKPYPRLDYTLDETRRSFQVLYLPPTAEKQPEPHSLRRPAYLHDARLPDSLHDAGVMVEICPFRDFVAVWLERCEGLIPPANVRLRTYLQFYRELWS